MNCAPCTKRFLLLTVDQNVSIGYVNISVFLMCIRYANKSNGSFWLFRQLRRIRRLKKN
jgi:hypothetical protein